MKKLQSGGTIDKDLFETQLQYLVKNNYKGLHFKDIEEIKVVVENIRKIEHIILNIYIFFLLDIFISIAFFI